MKVYSLTGHSGTGKSYQAPALMMEKGIDTLIDDGLLIHREMVEAGVSSKRQRTKIGATKTAIFSDDRRAQEVREKLEEIKPESLLIIGTSDKMVDTIVERLGLPPIYQRIYIEDITSARERAKAEKIRSQQGKHVIPVPTLQLKRDFAGYFMNPQKLMRQAKDVTDKAQEAIRNPGALLQKGKELLWDKTVVRPTYSYLGDFLINEKVISDIVACVAEETKGINHVVYVYENTEPDNLRITVVVDMDWDVKIWETAGDFQRRLIKVIEKMTAFNVVRADIDIRNLI